LIVKTNLLNYCQIEEGDVLDSDCVRYILGNVEVVGSGKKYDICKVQHVHIGKKGSEYLHKEGKVYLVFKTDCNGALMIRDTKEQYLLEEGNFYHIQSNMPHALKPISDNLEKKLRVLVFKFSSELIDDFKEGYAFKLNRAAQE
jgi:hypothetical protein